MGARGPISKRNLPTPLRIVETEDETHGPRRDVAADRVAPVAAEAPPELSGDLLDLYRVTMGELDAAGLASRLDAMALALAVTHYGAAMDAARELAAEGPVVIGGNGGPVSNPAATILKGQSAAFAELAKGLGLTYGARARIVVPKGESDALDRDNPFRGAKASG